METNGRLTFRFPTVAQVRKGTPKKHITKDGKEIEIQGDDLNDKFRIAFYPGCEEYRQLFINEHPELQGQKMLTVSKLHAMMPFEKVRDSLEIWNEAYQAGRMVFKATDRQVITRRDPLSGEYLVRNGDPYEAFDPQTKKAITYQRGDKTYSLPVRTSIRLKLFLPELMRMVAFELKSTSYYDKINLQDQLGAIQALADMLNRGWAGGIQFYIYRRQQEVCWNKKDGSAQRVSKWLINAEIDPEWVKAATQRMAQFAMTGQQIAGLLTPTTTPIQGEEDPNSEVLDPEDELQPGEPALEEPEFEEQPGPEFSEPPEGQVREDPAPAPELAVSPLRPYPPELLKQKLMDRAVTYQSPRGLARKPELREKVKLAIHQILDGVAIDCGQDIPTARCTLLFYLTGHRDIKQPPTEVILAMLAWLKPEPVGEGSPEWKIDSMAQQEAILAYKHAVNKETK